MKVEFYKYQGTGNDFVMLNNMNGDYNDLSLEQIQFLCNRKMGIGADGLIKLSSKEGFDFNVEYFNADGSQSFCGNGARCSVAFAKHLGLIEFETSFYAIDGEHKAEMSADGIVKLEMLKVSAFMQLNDDYITETGSPHYVRFYEEGDKVDIVALGKSIRYSEMFNEEGINVNALFVEGENEIRVLTYERGVEDETLSCGTGVTACALAYIYRNDVNSGAPIIVHTKGGTLSVEVGEYKRGEGFDDIWLSGPAKGVFDGVITI
ncbi:MAG: diaminopimelate epimerase [Crocinitomicaceae bacterium]|nr:diaminopimelate epimerase [Crocinitomicaceae bacterium]